jgi:hypothetical protein
MSDRPISEVLRELGFESDEQQQLARLVLEEAGLTRPGKVRISVGKLGRAVAQLDELLDRRCPSCAPACGRTRELVLVKASFCTNCGGSNIERALRRMDELCVRSGATRVLLVGGSPTTREEFNRFAGGVELKLVDGVARRTSRQVRADVDWADVVCICGGTQLDHSLSGIYSRNPHPRTKLARSARRGAEAIADAVTEHLRLRLAA